MAAAFGLPTGQLSPEASLRLHLRRVFAISAKLLDEPDTLERLCQIQRLGVAGKSSMEDALRRFAISLERQTAAFKGRKFGRQSLNGKPVNFDSSLRRLVQIASLASFFGPSFPADEIRATLVTFNDAFTSFAKTPPSLQGIMLKEACAARASLVRTLVAWLQSSAPEIEAIEMISELRGAAAEAGWGTTDIAKLLLAFVLTLIANGPGTLSWAMLHVAQASSEFVASLREEAANLFWTTPQEDGIDITAATMDAGFAMPNMTDVILETMRLYTSAHIHRVVEADTVLEHTWTVSPWGSGGERRKPRRRSVNFSQCPTPSAPSSRAPSPALVRTSSNSSCLRPEPRPSALKRPSESFLVDESAPEVRSESIFLKEGTSLVLCGRPAQLSEDCWGPDVKVWRPRRWEDADVGNDFWPWGGGVSTVSLCWLLPWSHIAQ